MKYYVQMIIATGSYTTELDQPEEIAKEEFAQKNINDWCESYIADNYGSDEDEQIAISMLAEEIIEKLKTKEGK